jgi:V/A-type H+/Na+-transporting ATPase subunit G/H
MSIENIAFIKEAEEMAESMKVKAQEEARQILSLANQKANRLLEDALEGAQKQAKEILKNYEWKAQNQVLAMEDQVLKECEEIKKTGSEKLDQAVERIIGRVVSMHGNR